MRKKKSQPFILNPRAELQDSFINKKQIPKSRLLHFAVIEM